MTLSAHQIHNRANAIGASDVSAILGLNPYRGPFDVWARFHLPDETVERHADDPTRPDFRRWGDILEEPIAQEYARREGVEIRKLADDETWRHPTKPYLIGHPDRLLVDRRRGLEVKTANLRVAHRWGPEEQEVVPDEYRIQCASYMAMGEYERWDLAVLLGGSDYRTYRLKRDESIEGPMLEGVETFWEENIRGKVRPPIATSPQAEQWIKRLFPRNTRPLIEDPSAELLDLARLYASWRDTAKHAEDEKAVVGAKLREAIGEAEGFRWGPKQRCKATFRNSKDGVELDAKGLLAELNPPDELVQKYSRVKPGPRVLLVDVKAERNEGSK